MQENHRTYLANLTNLNSLSSTVKRQEYNSAKFYSKNMLNFLLVGLENGIIKIYIFGVLSCGTINIKQDINATVADEISIIDVKLSFNFKQLFVVFQKNGKVELMIYENNILLKYHVPLWTIAVKYGQVLNIMK